MGSKGHDIHLTAAWVLSPAQGEGPRIEKSSLLESFVGMILLGIPVEDNLVEGIPVEDNFVEDSLVVDILEEDNLQKVDLVAGSLEEDSPVEGRKVADHLGTLVVGNLAAGSLEEDILAGDTLEEDILEEDSLVVEERHRKEDLLVGA